SPGPASRKHPVWTGGWDSARVPDPLPGVTFLGREDAVARHREARGDVLAQGAQLVELVEAAVIHPAVPLLVERQRPLQQQLFHELVVRGGSGDLDGGRATIGGA